jgi:hypothetical protein
MKRVAFVVLVTLIGAVGCSRRDDTAAAAPAPARPPASGPRLVFQKLGSLGLEAEVPADTSIIDNTKGAGFLSATVYASTTTFVSGPGELSDVKPTLDETKAELAKDPNRLVAVTRQDATRDGWIIEVTRESMIDRKELYGVSVRRTIAGKAWDCGTNADSREEIAKVERLCASLRAAK